jgi:hypothetical protein
VASSPDGEIHLRREELILGREGRLGFGHPVAANPGEAVSFVLVQSGS